MWNCRFRPYRVRRVEKVGEHDDVSLGRHQESLAKALQGGSEQVEAVEDGESHLKIDR